MPEHRPETGVKSQRDVELEWYIVYLQLGLDVFTAARLAQDVAEASRPWRVV